MIYLTEFDLREQFKESPFDQFVVKEDIKLTPGARQFLLDKRVKIISDIVDNINKPKNYTKDINHDDLLKQKSSESNLFNENFHMLVSKIIFYILSLNKINSDLAKKSYKIVKLLNGFCYKKDTYSLDKEINVENFSLPKLNTFTKNLLNFSFEELLESNKTKELNLIYLICFELKKFFETNENNLDIYQKEIIANVFKGFKNFID